ncbi:MAG: cupin domain-containing protein [Pseudomonadota bacterium]
MEINADFSQRVLLRTNEMEWAPSPQPGVRRRMLDRIGDEVARATTIVEFAPKSAFDAHTHGGGEEFLVLDGVFSDEHGDFPAGSYVRNPPTSKHTPSSAPGCVILVKLHQFDPADRTHVRIDTKKQAPTPHAERPGVSIQPLFADGREEVRIETWAPNAEIRLEAAGGLEAFLLSGAMTEGGETLGPRDWLRSPSGAPFIARAGSDGATLWVKTGHLAETL